MGRNGAVRFLYGWLGIMSKITDKKFKQNKNKIQFQKVMTDCKSEAFKTLFEVDFKNKISKSFLFSSINHSDSIYFSI